MGNPIQEYNKARTADIPLLIKVLNGQSDFISDLGVAHAMLKEKLALQVAKKGAEAGQMAQAPKLVQRDMQMAQGLASTPADVNVPMGGIVGDEGQMTQTAAGGGSVVAFQAGGLGALNMSGNEIKSFIDQMVKKGVPPAQINQFAQQAQAVAAKNPGALRGFLGTAARTFFGTAAPMIGFTDALIASERGGRAATGATPGYNYVPEEMVSGIEPGVVGPSTNKSTIEQLFSNIGAIMPSGPSAQTREAQEVIEARQRAATQNFGQADTGGVPTQTLADFEAAQKKKQEETAAAAGAGGPGGGPAGVAGIAAAQARVQQPIGQTYEQMRQVARDITGQLVSDAEPNKTAAQLMEDYNKTLTAAGFDFGLMSKQMGELAKEKEELKKDRKEAANLRLIEAGLGVLGGESPDAFVNIGKGATPALQGLAKDLKDIKAQSRALNKETLQLQVMQNQMAEGRGKFTFDALEKQKAEVRRVQQLKAQTEASIFSTLVSKDTSLQVAQMSRDTSLEVARIGASKVGETMQIIQSMPGKTFDERFKNYSNIAKGDPKERAKVEALYKLATDPTEMNRIKRSDSALYEQLKTLLQGGLASAGMITEKPSTGPIRN